MEKDSTEVTSGQVMSMFQRMMEKMEQDKQELKREREQDKQEMNTRMDHIKDEVGGVKKEIAQTSNRLYFVEEAMKRSSRASSRSTSRATSPTAAAGIPTVTRIPDGIEQRIATPLPQLRSKRIFTPATTYKHEDLKTLLQNIEIDEKMPVRKGDRRETIFDEVSRGGQKVTELQDHVVLQTDSFSNIVLRDLTLDQVLVFYRKVYNYDMQHVVKIPKLFLRMSEGVQATVTHAMTQIYSDRYKSTYRVQDATREELLHAIKWHLCPSDCQDFNEKLVESCQDYKVQRVEDDFSKTSVKLGKLREKFEERYEFLSEACTLCKLTESIPKLKWKDGGILQVFLELTRGNA
jgi:hypothetical protein